MTRIDTLNQFLTANPNDCFVRHALALEYIKINNDSQAEILFEAILLYNENYVGSYYHLAKLYYRIGKIDSARATYEKGLLIAKLQNDNHSYNELQAALDDLDDE
jgi:Tfp pilus assembly protein PilF